jgi:hypothetical protein
LFLIGREAMANAFRRHGGRAVEIEIGYGPRASCGCATTAVGLPAGVVAADGHFGLQGMRTSGPRGRAARSCGRGAWDRSGAGGSVRRAYLQVRGLFTWPLAGAGFRCRKAVMETETMASTIE